MLKSNSKILFCFDAFESLFCPPFLLTFLHYSWTMFGHHYTYDTENTGDSEEYTSDDDVEYFSNELPLGYH